MFYTISENKAQNLYTTPIDKEIQICFVKKEFMNICSPGKLY